MKRDMDLVRKILLAMDADEHGYILRDLNIEGYPREQIGYHCYLLHDAGLIEGMDLSANDCKSPYYRPKHLTWQGHEFIENAKSDKVWGQAKEAIAKIGDASFSVWGSVLTTLVTRNLGL